ncbi:hypothetical protein NL108_006880 [Boleophthalmus pectinirostris]|nr:hypothetical protein NL108_006880 [Boleophthalmus pectinirostris]
MENMWKSTRRGQRCYNQRTWSSTLQPGDHVLVRNLAPRGGPGKLRSYWEEDIYVVRERRGPDSPVYAVEPLQGVGERRVLHRNLLLPCPYLVNEPPGDVPQPATRRARTRRNQTLEPELQQIDTENSSEEDFEIWMAHQPVPPLDRAAAGEPMLRESQNDRTMPALQPESIGPDSPGGVPGPQDDPQTSATESEEEQRELTAAPQRPVRARQPRRLYTYEQLGKPSVRELHSCPIGVRGAEGVPDNYRRPYMYPFSRY